MRIRVLELPMETVGDDVTTPFMLIVDRAPVPFLHPDQMERIREVAKSAGARTVLVTSEEVDLDTDHHLEPRSGGSYELQMTNG